VSKVKISALTLLAAATLMLGGGAAWLKTTGLSARATAGPLETRAAQLAKRFAIPVAYRGLRNPMMDTPEDLLEARNHFADHCASCHANDGSGKTTLGKGMFPPAPDMRLPATQQLTDGELYYIIQHGVRFTGMPGWGEPGFFDHQTWHLVMFIRRLPTLTQQEIDGMRNYNPRSPAEMAAEEEAAGFLNSAPETKSEGKASSKEKKQ
jgi:mono/diheme cytochrome c family protein